MAHIADMRVLLTLTLLLLATPSFAQTADDVDALTKKEQAARKKTTQLSVQHESVRKDVADLKKKLAKSAREAQKIEVELGNLENQTAELNSRVQTLKTQIADDRIRNSELLAALQRLEATPPPTLILSPRNAKQAAQAGQLMATLSGQLKHRAESLSLNLTALDVTQAQITIKRGELAQTRDRLNRETTKVETGLAKKSTLEAKLSDERNTAAAEAKRLAAESKNLLDLIAKLESEAAKVVPRPKPGRKSSPKLVLPKGTKKFADAKGSMLRPVSGRIVKKFGKSEKGLTLAGRAGGKVLSPYAGRVEFSGPFKNYDQLVILNVGDGYFVLLTGLNSLFVGTGDTVRRGEPVGNLPNQSGSELYIELRRNGSPIDPMPWLAPNQLKSG